MSEIQVLSQEQPSNRPASKIPLYMSMGYTLNISLRFLVASVAGRGSVALGDELLSWWAEKIFRAANARMTAVGRENFAPGQAYVVMSNHRSSLDIPALFLAVPGSLRMVIKQELTRIPIWGRAMVASGFVPVDRKNHSRAVSQLEEAKKHLSSGVNVWIAPEGTRSLDGELGDFKKGGFHMARQLGLPIMPAWITGTDVVIPPKTFDVTYDQRASVRFGAPISTEGVGTDDIAPLIQEVRSSLLSLSRG